MSEQQRKNRTAFFASFCATLALMGGVLSAVLFFFAGRERQQVAYQGPVSVYLPDKSDRMNLLLVGREQKDSPPEIFLLYGFLPDQGRISLFLLPPKTVLDYNGQSATLEKLYSQGGIKYLAKAAAQSFGIAIERTAEMELSGLEGIMDQVGLTDYYLPVELDYPLRGRQITMHQGNQQLDGRKLADILLYPAYSGGELERSDRGVMLLSQLLTQNLSVVLGSKGDSLITTFLNHVKSDISFPDYEVRKPAARFLAGMKTSPVTAVYLEGSLTRDYERFILTEDCRRRIGQMFGNEQMAIGTSGIKK